MIFHSFWFETFDDETSNLCPILINLFANNKFLMNEFFHNAKIKIPFYPKFECIVFTNIYSRKIINIYLEKFTKSF